MASDLRDSKEAAVSTVDRTPILVYVLNGVMIVAGFSILVASLYAVSTMLGLCVTIVLSLFLPKQIFEHITTAAVSASGPAF